MNSNTILEMKNRLDSYAQIISAENIEFWFARDLQEPLGYTKWENFITAIKRAIESCKSTNCNPDDHFRGVTKLIEVARGAERQIEDFMLTRYACYLIAQNGDPRKEVALEVSSGNVFADLGIENPEEELTKAKLVWEIEQIIKKKKLTQAAAAALMGINQPKVSALLKRKLDGFSVERLIHFLNALV